MRVAIIGYGRVAAIHARQLARDPSVELSTVLGPDAVKAADFAKAHQFQNSTTAFGELVETSQAAIICSPSSLHFEQARECLESGLHVLVELPPCQTHEEACQLGQLARNQDRVLRCAHTSRYLAPYLNLKKALQENRLGPLKQIDYLRHLQLVDRSWKDNALLHHSAHPLDVLLDWYGTLRPVAAVAGWSEGEVETVCLLAEIRTAPVSIAVSYASRLPQSRMVVVGGDHTAETDGFSFLGSDLDSLQQAWNAQESYHQAIYHQDMDFIDACRSGKGGVAWEETQKLLEVIGFFTSQLERNSSRLHLPNA